MAVIPRASLGLVTILVLALAILMPAVQAQAPAPAPTSDGAFDLSHPSILWTSIDQGIAYLLMLVALVLTYLIHPLDASSLYELF
ncbi:Arabinogalactan peptide [Musa troglodytarum]|uniref:Arabinogalactan peptide n=1 Tax=Musa troglodytarum TaxID=320322 RepID=A0A9E7KLS2_9LILI|nr:Arabinogalactan peptide [Musa troglodytarum]